MDNYTFFQRLAMPAFLFTLFFTFCRHKNPGGALLIPGCIALCIYLCYSIKKINMSIKKGSIVFLAFILLFGISCFLTGYETFWFYSHTGILVSATAFLIYNAYDSKKWSFVQQLAALCKLIGFTTIEVPAPISGLIAASKVGKAKKLLQVFIALAIALPLMLIIVALLVSADAIFGSLVDGVFGKFSFGNIISIMFMSTFVFFLSYCSIKALLKEDNSDLQEMQNTKFADPFIGIIITSLISVVYLIFSNVQIFGLFLGKMSLPEGLTYSEYARKGFFQLMFVCFINLIIVLICKTIFRKNVVLNTFLMIISVSTGIMLASSAFKMYMYTSVYGLTRLRFTTFAGQITIAVLLLGIMINVLFPNFGLYRFGLITILTGYMLLSFSHMDYWIVKYNVTRENIDTDYISWLSTDAVPALVEYDDFSLLNEYYNYHEANYSNIYELLYFDEYTGDYRIDYVYGDKTQAHRDTFRTFNISHYMYTK